jgi:hypothetical protein
MNVLKNKIAHYLYAWLEKNQPEEMQRRIKLIVDRVASDVSIRATMIALERDGLLHCGCCAQRYGLHRVKILDRETYLCDKHYSQWQQSQMAEATK